jgi:thioredoxin 1
MTQKLRNVLTVSGHWRSVRNLTDDTFDVILTETKPVLVEFWAEWCGPCKMMAPVLEALDKENNWLEVVKINADENPNTAKKYDVSSIPTTLLFKNGKVVEYHVGALPKFKLLGIINEHK